jgi:hypothetical protein
MNKQTWVKSSYSGGQSADCVEIAALPGGGRAVRDSKDQDGPMLTLSARQWAELVKSVLGPQDARNPRTPR